MSKAKNVLGGRLESCSESPLTGFTGRGFCETGPSDLGSHPGMPVDDEPIFPDNEPELPVGPDPGSQLANRIRRLVRQQLYGVLCTQGQGQPYGSLIAFAFSDDLSQAVFATPTATRKYRLLSECDRVSVVVDNRPHYPHDMMKVEALTATGKAMEVPRGPDFQELETLLISSHPQLKSFVKASSCALFRIDIFRFFHVGRFQEVGQWTPQAL